MGGPGTHQQIIKAKTTNVSWSTRLSGLAIVQRCLAGSVKWRLEPTDGCKHVVVPTARPIQRPLRRGQSPVIIAHWILCVVRLVLVVLVVLVVLIILQVVDLLMVRIFLAVLVVLATLPDIVLPQVTAGDVEGFATHRIRE